MDALNRLISSNHNCFMLLYYKLRIATDKFIYMQKSNNLYTLFRVLMIDS